MLAVLVSIKGVSAHLLPSDILCAAVDVCLLESEIPGNPPTQVAVKRLKYEALRHRRDLDRFFKEASMLRKLRHRCVFSLVL